ncbi:MAG: DUF6869 domain-containing protein [Burkholderiaceae bacterium]
MTDDELEHWADAYIRIQSQENDLSYHHPLWWAVGRSHLPNDETDPEEAWRFILRVLSKNPNDRVYGILAAGSLEDLINYFGPQFIDRIEKEAAASASFRELLGGVWESSTPEIWKRIEAARGEPW